MRGTINKEAARGSLLSERQPSARGDRPSKNLVSKQPSRLDPRDPGAIDRRVNYMESCIEARVNYGIDISPV